MISQFFIDRPKFAFVISIVITLVGLIAITVIPVGEFPQIAPPQVKVTASYPGANAAIIEQTVAAPIEGQVNGVEDMLYMSSTSTNSGSYTLTVTFRVGTDPDLASVNVQNRVALAEPQLPDDVRRQGISVKAASTNMLLVVNLFSPNGSYDSVFLSNYADINVRDALVRLPGVGDATILGATPYGMRVWLEPDRLTALGLTADDVAAAIRSQNLQATAGQVGAAPAAPGTQFQYSILAAGRLDTPEQFADIIVRANPDGSLVRISDVGRVELGAQTYGSYGTLNGQPAAALAIYQSPDGNALQIAEEVAAELERLSQRFPDDIAYQVTYDTTRYVSTTIDEVLKTLLEAFVLVVFVTYVFLQNWRALLIPIVAIPVSLIGTFAVLLALGFTANTISLFALILAISLVVDDAIIVVENVQRLMTDEGLDRRAATRKAMRQISGPVIATTLVLLAVFVPVGFMPGLVGRLFQEFAVTISVSVLISAINALTLSPALCASLLNAESHATRGPFGLFNRGFEAVRGRYAGTVSWMSRRSIVGIAVLLVTLGASFHLFTTLPKGFLPQEDRGAFFVDLQLPDAAAFARTEVALAAIQEMLNATPGVADVITIPGFSMLSGGNLSNAGLAIVVLDPWDERGEPELIQAALQRRVQGQLLAMTAGNAFAFAPPPISGLGLTAGFDYRLQDTGGHTPQELAEVAGALIYGANQDPALAGVFTTFRASVPQLFLEIDRRKVETLGIPLSTLFSTLQTNLGSLYVNDFNMLGRVFRVVLQADAPFRSKPADISRLHVRSATGEMVPLRTLVTVETVLGPQQLDRYNMFRAVTINGGQAPGHSSGEAIAAMERLSATELPQGFGFEWSGLTQQQIEAAGKTSMLLVLAIVFVYLFLVAQYESWTLPLVVILSVPVAALGALLALLLTSGDINVYTQIGLVLLIGLASKNAILIAEFAKHLRETGASIAEAAVQAASLRFRAILMTSFAFVLGVVPLVLATGAGAGSRNAIGNAVFGGMLLAVTVGVFLIPALYVVIQRLVDREKPAPAPTDGTSPADA